MGAPAASILLPVRDGAETLERALISLERQTFIGFELLCVDDGSRDGTRDLLERWALRDPRLRILEQERLGIVSALNHALEASRGPILVRQDADDVSHPRRLERLLGTLQADSQVDAVGSRICGFPRQALGVGMRRYEEWQNGLLRNRDMRRERFVESPMAHASTAFRREALEGIGGWRDAPWPEDLDLWIRFFASGRRAAKREETLYFWGERKDRTTRVDPRLDLTAHRACKLHYLAEQLLGERGPVEVWGKGALYRGWVESLESAGHEVRAVEVDPKRVRREGAPALPSRPASPLLVALTAPVSRKRLRPVLAGLGLEEERDYLFVY